MNTLQAYKKSVKIKESIKLLDAAYGLSAEDKKKMSELSYWKSERIVEEIGVFPAETLQQMYNGLCAELRMVRWHMSNQPIKRPSTLDQIVNKGMSLAKGTVGLMFPKHNMSVVITPRPSFEPKRSYFGDNVVGIPKSWLRSVCERHISWVKGANGDCFILSAKPRKSPVFETEYFSVVALRMKDKAFFLEDGWVAKANGISAYSDDLKKAQSLLNRRVRAKIMREFLGE